MSGTPPFVSVVVPTHRRREMLLRLVASLRAQDYPADRYEILVVHNAPDDGTAAAMTGLVAEGGLPALAYHPKNFSSPTPSRQFGAGIARGDVVAFIDDDCEASPGWIAAGVAAMAEGVGVVQGRTLPRSDQPRRFLEKTVCVTGPTPYFETCNIFYRRDAFAGVGGFSDAFMERFWGEDTDLGWKVTGAGWGRAFAPEALVRHEVFRQSFLAWHKEALNLRVWPLLVKMRPEIRRELYGRYFVSRQSAAFALGVAGLAGGALVHPVLLAAMLPYPVVRVVETGRYRNPAAIAARVLLGLPRAALIFGALAYGSVIHRRLVL
ncbi:glycosyltransferase [Methylobacterium sp. sgz302541]|uniref:glycosyltransferase n=1 Tax=unclassified Methylobacterium TaxID=2615210 RepID=UPI003D33E127